MIEPDPHPTTVNAESLERLRTVMGRLDPTRPIQRPDQQPWYVQRPDGFSNRLGRTLQIDPTSTHLVVGSIGSGKSTELLAAGRVVLGTPGVYARYVEVTRVMALESASAEALVLAVVDDLVGHLAQGVPGDAEIIQLQEELSPWVNGYWKDSPGFRQLVSDALTVPKAGQFVEPRLKRPEAGTSIPRTDWLERCWTLVQRLRKGRLAWLIDGLDRIADPIEFDRIVEPFLHALKAAGIGVVVVGPRRSIAGLDRLGVADTFDEIHMVHPIDRRQPEGERFLHEVLSRRGVDEVSTAEAREFLVARSGGAIRILLQLTKEAIKQAWISNEEQARLPHAELAAYRTGRSLLWGLSDAELKLLQALVKTGEFAPRTAEELALVLTNRVMDYEDSSMQPRYAAHPTLVRFLAALPG